VLANAFVAEQAGGALRQINPVSIRFNVKDGKYRLKDLVCYVAGQGKASLDWFRKKIATASKCLSRLRRGRIKLHYAG